MRAGAGARARATAVSAPAVAIPTPTTTMFAIPIVGASSNTIIIMSTIIIINIRNITNINSSLIIINITIIIISDTLAGRRRFVLCCLHPPGAAPAVAIPILTATMFAIPIVGASSITIIIMSTIIINILIITNIISNRFIINITIINISDTLAGVRRFVLCCYHPPGAAPAVAIPIPTAIMFAIPIVGASSTTIIIMSTVMVIDIRIITSMVANRTIINITIIIISDTLAATRSGPAALRVMQRERPRPTYSTRAALDTVIHYVLATKSPFAV